MSLSHGGAGSRALYEEIAPAHITQASCRFEKRARRAEYEHGITRGPERQTVDGHGAVDVDAQGGRREQRGHGAMIG